MRGIGRLDERITIQAVTVSQGDYGQAVEAWADVCTVFAHKKELNGTEKLTNEKEAATSRVEFVIRYRENITPSNRVLSGSRVYDITSVKEGTIARRDSLTILCQEVS